MKERGIIMSGSHPVDILEGRKTMTRRTWGLEEVNKNPDAWILTALGPKARFSELDSDRELMINCPYGIYFDRLWARESWATENRYNHLRPSEIPRTAKIFYLADGSYSPFEMGKVRPPLFMPRWASRILLEITQLGVERLQAITEEDALAEGIKVMQGTWQAMEKDIETGRLKLSREPQPYTARYHFEALWDSLNAKKYPWAVNPWCWTIIFKEV